MYSDTPATENAEQHATKLTKRHLAKLFWVLTVPFLFPSVLAAEPSLAETIQYIEAKLSNSPGLERITFRLNGGKITHTSSDYGSREVSTFQLDALSTTVDVEHGDIPKWKEVKISCARGRCISSRSLFKDDDGDYEERNRKMIGGMSFEVYSIDAEKIKKALTHAIRISGGKDELF